MASKDTIRVENFINGKFCSANKFIDSYDPATGKVWAKIPDSGEPEVEDAVSAAKQAFKSWSKTSVDERAKYLFRIADILESKENEFSVAESRDQGKPIWLAKKVDMNRSVLNFRAFAHSLQSDNDISKIQPEADLLNYTIHVPVGVVGVITPWNLPLYLLTFKLAPALAYGNTVVAKPSEFTSVTAWMLCSVLQEAGLPPGVVNMVFGYGHKVGEALIKHPEVPLISFTGSTKTGTHIQEVASSQVKRLSLEMGGKNAAIVFGDANLNKCLPDLIRASFLNSGQICLCTSRIFVERNIYENFKQKFAELAKNIKVGVPQEEESWMGPINNKLQYEKIQRYLEIARQEGATFLTGNETLNLPAENKQGYFLPPTVLTDLSSDSKCMQDEIFGPVTCILPFDTEEEVVKLANNVQYGLCASLWSQNVRRIHKIAYQLEVGTIWCNCWLIRDLQMPFGGMKMSGIGREGTLDSREFFTEKKTICIKYD
ncbi:2-aminomuconic semialdehyde dehydrogenase-like [Centruroides vittatus]|uniref:2-aminomuconic semialdehyde dehydrogenase-like n=1 Tax=Centruroides vittatus TaxID=120091 RepID=UPI00350F881D